MLPVYSSHKTSIKMLDNKRVEEPVVLKRQLGLWSCIAMTISPIIGSGIFISPKGILRNLDGSVGWSLIMWMMCGIFAIVGALSMAEVSNMIRKSGGYFVYILTAYSKLLAFIVVFVFTVATRPAANLIIIVTMSRYFLSPFVSSSDCELPDTAILLFAMVIFSKFVI